jgi:pyridoxine 4-dehydrogenase
LSCFLELEGGHQVVSQTDSYSIGTFALGGDLPINRLGFGAMRLTGPGIWGPPEDPDECVRVLRHAVELGVNFIDTADSYGPHISEELIREALYPYADGVVIATKGGIARGGPVNPDVAAETPPADGGPGALSLDGKSAASLALLGHPVYLRQQCEMSLRRLGGECIDLYQLHRIDPNYPLEDQVGELAALRQEGKIRHIGLSEVDVDQLRAAQQIAPIASVQNRYNVFEREAEPLLEVCEKSGIGFIPWAPLSGGDHNVFQRITERHHATPSQLALAWLLKRSPVIVPIPGTTKVAHLEENVAAATIALSDDEFTALSDAAG